MITPRIGLCNRHVHFLLYYSHFPYRSLPVVRHRKCSFQYTVQFHGECTCPRHLHIFRPRSVIFRFIARSGHHTGTVRLQFHCSDIDISQRLDIRNIERHLLVLQIEISLPDLVVTADIPFYRLVRLYCPFVILIYAEDEFLGIGKVKDGSGYREILTCGPLRH